MLLHRAPPPPGLPPCAFSPVPPTTQSRGKQASMHNAGHAVTHTNTLPKPLSLQSRTTLPARLRHTPTYNTTCNNHRSNQDGWEACPGNPRAPTAHTSLAPLPHVRLGLMSLQHTLLGSHTHHHLLTGLANNTCASLLVRGRGSNAPKQGSSNICLLPSLGPQLCSQDTRKPSG